MDSESVVAGGDGVESDAFKTAYESANQAFSKLHLSDRREQEVAADLLAQAVDEMGRFAKSPSFTVLMEKSLGEVHRRLYDLMQGGSMNDKFGAILAIGRLVPLADDQGQLGRYANYLRLGLPCKDAALMREAASCLGAILARPDCPPSLAELELGRVFRWLQERSTGSWPTELAACLVAESLLTHAGTSISSAYLSALFDALWALLRESRHSLEAASRATRAALCLVRSRYDAPSLAAFAQRTLSGLCEDLRGGSPLPALLLLGHLLACCAEVLDLEYHIPSILPPLITLASSKQLALRMQVFELIPALAAQVPKGFAQGGFLATWISVLVEALRKDKDHTLGLMAVASTANALGAEIGPHLGRLAQSLRTLLLLLISNHQSGEAAALTHNEEHWLHAVISSLADACKAEFLPSARLLLPLVLQEQAANGLSDSAVAALVACMRATPTVIPFIEGNLLAVSTKELLHVNLTRVHLAIRLVASTPFPRSFLATDAAKRLADLATDYSRSVETRLLAAKGLIRHAVKRRDDVLFCESPPQISAILRRLLASCLLDTHQGYIDVLLQLILAEPSFDLLLWADPHLVEQLFTLFLAASISGRLAVLSACQRLSRNRIRALLRPHIRGLLLQLATALEGQDSLVEPEEAARLLERLVQVDDALVRPYVRPLVEILVARLQLAVQDISGSLSDCVPVLEALTHLVALAPADFVPFGERLLDGLLDGLASLGTAPTELRLAALRSLGALLRNVDRSQLALPRITSLIHRVVLPILLGRRRQEGEATSSSALSTEDDDPQQQQVQLRQEALRLLGIIGAIDPHRMRTFDQQLSIAAEQPDDQSSQLQLAEEHYPVVASAALLRLLGSSSLLISSHIPAAIQALVYIFRAGRARASPLLATAMPVLLRLTAQESGDQLLLCHSLAHIVAAVGLHIRPWSAQLIAVIKNGLASAQRENILAVLSLAEALLLALRGECRPTIEEGLLPPCLALLSSGCLEDEQMAQKALPILACFGQSLVELLPIFVFSLEQVSRSSTSPDLHLAILRALIRLLPELDWSPHVPGVLRLTQRALSASHEGRIGAAAIDLLTLLRRGYDLSVRPHSTLVSRLLDESLPAQQSHHTQSHHTVTHANSASGALDGLLLESSSEMLNVPARKLSINEGNLRRAWEGHLGCVAKEDWWEWWRKLGLEMIRESPAQAIKACSLIAAAHYPLVRELFNVAFLSCWTGLSPALQDELIGALEDALASQEVPAEVIQAFLNLAESMEHQEHPLPVDITTLGSYAIRCHAYAKALYYKELEFQANPSAGLVEALISLNSQLQLPDAASGILYFAQKKHGVKLKESWHEKLQQWDDALAAYEKRWEEAPQDTEALLGLFRCRLALGDWGGLTGLAGSLWSELKPDLQLTIAPWAASSAWGVRAWSAMDRFVERIPEDTIDGSFFRAILAARDQSYEKVADLVQLTRGRLDPDLTAMLNESYSRAYRTIVRVQMLAELEEVVEYRLTSRPGRKESIRDTWSKRLLDCQESVDVWQRMLKTRALVIEPAQEQDLWIHFAGLCRRMHRPLLSRHVLLTLLGVVDNDEGGETGHALVDLATSAADPPVVYALLEHYWDVGEHERALSFMKQYARLLSHQLDALLKQQEGDLALEERTKMLARCYIRLGKWQKAMLSNSRDVSSSYTSTTTPISTVVSEDVEGMSAVLDAFLTATSYDKNSRKAWHGWALTNYDLAAIYERQRAELNNATGGGGGGRLKSNPWIVPAIQGFFRSIALAASEDPDGALQDSLRLLTLWFRYGTQPEVNAAVGDGFYTVPVDNWLQVIPQLIARIHVPSPQVRRLVHHVLSDIGRQHPQALLYPLTVASKAQSISRRTSALAILDKMKAHAARLVDQAVTVSQELIRVAITWEELWYEALEEASRLYFGDHNVAAMLQTLDGLHAQIERPRETQREVAFYQAYGQTLRSARELCQQYKKSAKEEDLKEAWELYYQVFRKINKQLPQLTTLDLESASPRLLASRNLDIPIPGTYRAGAPTIKIASVAPVMSVIASKQRPRKLVFIGSDGKKYKFLLKGHEDLRQDERVMQLFGLVNSLLATDRETSKRYLAIQRYSVVPLSQNTGLIGWVPHCDTVHTLIRDYRESRGIMLSAEHRLMLQFAPDFDNLMELQKVEVFLHAMANTDGMDLNRIMWKKSLNAESWLERRTSYTRSLAVMSMVGYILGLGDRHPSNLMIDQVTGQVVHIDFGDCFEAAQQREKFPERVPFRLTRMLVKAMEVSQVEGTFRVVSEHTMRVLRENKDSVMAVLEAFVYDPLINWRILTKASEPRTAQRKLQGEMNYAGIGSDDGYANFPENFSTTRRARLGDEISRLEEESINRPDAMNAGALNVVTHVSNKLTGREFSTVEPLDIKAQVDRLVQDATKVESLCQAYVGWCPFW